MTLEQLKEKYIEALKIIEDQQKVIRYQQRLLEQGGKTIDDLDNLSLIDNLTKVYNRNYFNKIKNLSGSIIMIDLDHFKRINDNYSHEKGDEVLKKTSDLIKKSIRKDDILIRHGGDEFVVFLNNCPVIEAVKVMEKIQINLKNESQNFGLNPDDNVTFSVGITEKLENDNIDEVLKEADELMYQSKNSGRDKVSYNTKNIRTR